MTGVVKYFFSFNKVIQVCSMKREGSYMKQQAHISPVDVRESPTEGSKSLDEISVTEMG